MMVTILIRHYLGMEGCAFLYLKILAVFLTPKAMCFYLVAAIGFENLCPWKGQNCLSLKETS